MFKLVSAPGEPGPARARPKAQKLGVPRPGRRGSPSQSHESGRRRRATRTRIVRPGLSQAQAARLTPTRSHESESRVSGSELCQ